MAVTDPSRLMRDRCAQQLMPDHRRSCLCALLSRVIMALYLCSLGTALLLLFNLQQERAVDVW
jgi:hypothetical protein